MSYQPTTTTIIIKNVKFEKKYLGRYKKIFSILNADNVFCEVYETDNSIGWKDGNYYLEVSCLLDCNEYEQISKLKNIEILD
jgi:hypothetical protein